MTYTVAPRIAPKQSAKSAVGLANESLYRDSGGTTSSTGALPLASLTVAAGVTERFPSAGGTAVICFATGATTTVTYTSTDATHFLGCTGGTGTLLGGEEIVIPPTPGNPVSPVETFLPASAIGQSADSDTFSPKLMFGYRNVNSFPLGGAAKYDGTLTGALFPQDGTLLMVAGIGKDADTGKGVISGSDPPKVASAVGRAATGSETALTFADTYVYLAVTANIRGSETETCVASVVVPTGSVATTVDVIDVTVDRQILAEEYNVYAATSSSSTPPAASSLYLMTTVNATTDPTLVITLQGAVPTSGTTPPADGRGSLTLADASGVGATTLVLSGATNITAGTTIVRIDVNGTSTTAECRLVKTLATDTITVDALQYAHAASVSVMVVAGPFGHQLSEQNLLPYLTTEQQLDYATGEGMQFTGNVVDKLDIKIESTNKEIDLTASLKGQHYQSLANDDLSPIKISGNSPFTGFQTTLAMLGLTNLTQCKSLSFSVENAVEVDTCLGSHDPEYITPETMKVVLDMKMLFSSLTDSTDYDFLTQLLDINLAAGVQTTPMVIQIVDPANDLMIEIDLSKVTLTKVTQDVKMANSIMESVSAEAYIDLSTGTTLSAIIVNNQPDAF